MIYCAFPHFKLAESPAKHLDSHQAAPVFPNLAWHDQKIKTYAYEIHCGLVWPIVAYCCLLFTWTLKRLKKYVWSTFQEPRPRGWDIFRNAPKRPWFVLICIAGSGRSDWNGCWNLCHIVPSLSYLSLSYLSLFSLPFPLYSRHFKTWPMQNFCQTCTSEQLPAHSALHPAR